MLSNSLCNIACNQTKINKFIRPYYKTFIKRYAQEAGGKSLAATNVSKRANGGIRSNNIQRHESTNYRQIWPSSPFEGRWILFHAQSWKRTLINRKVLQDSSEGSWVWVCRLRSRPSWLAVWMAFMQELHFQVDQLVWNWRHLTLTDSQWCSTSTTSLKKTFW